MSHLKCWSQAAMAVFLALPAAGQTFQVYPAPLLSMPAVADSNSPVFWRDGAFYIINSTGESRIAAVADQYSFDDAEWVGVGVDAADHFPMWIESVWQDVDGTLYAWYHHERQGVCGDAGLTMPEIGALVSVDGGYNFFDLGIVLASGEDPDCSAKNGFFAGGHGDFSVILDPAGGYFYFLFDNYGGPADSQGVAIARMAFEDRLNPVGAVWKFHNGAWEEPGIGGAVTPILRAATPWSAANPDAFWGPSIHWNSALHSYVMLMSHACCGPNWPQEGIYISFNSDLSNPQGWSTPQKVLSGKEIGFSPGYYPQIIGVEYGETDTLAGEVARLYIKGVSRWEIVFQP